MKKITALLLLLAAICLPACGESHKVTESEIPLETEMVTEIFQSYNLPYVCTTKGINGFFEYCDCYDYSIDNPDVKNHFGYYGNVQMYDDEKCGRKVLYYINSDREIPVEDTDRLRAVASAVCDMYGDMENKSEIIDDFIAFMESGKCRENPKGKDSVWEFQSGDLYFETGFHWKPDGSARTLTEFTIYDKTRKKFDDAAPERELRKAIERNPYKYTDKKQNFPKEPSADKVNGFLEDSGLALTARDYSEMELYGTKNVIYNLTNKDGKGLGRLSLEYNKSGTEVSIGINPMGDEAIGLLMEDDYVINAAKVLCQVYGRVKDADGLIEKVEQKIAEEHSDYKKHNSESWYIENKGMYIVAYYDWFRLNDKSTVCNTLYLYSKDTLKAALYTAKDTDSWEGQLYREIFGNN
ncbi:MAG: hypothetical protein IJ362_09595 [Oscillospiraceae bacterium]|nr:hypothetical protein [Oscillospiraceae bacterium]